MFKLYSWYPFNDVNILCGCKDIIITRVVLRPHIWLVSIHMYTFIFKASPNAARFPANTWIHCVTPKRVEGICIWIPAEVLNQGQVTLRKYTCVCIYCSANMRSIHVPMLTLPSSVGCAYTTHVTLIAQRRVVASVCVDSVCRNEGMFNDLCALVY